jgi:DNA-binding CsgD family transcriptional regulator
MQYLFFFLLISCLSVGLLTYLLALAFFVRGKGAAEKLFLAFLSCFTVRMLVDTVIFYVLPHLAPSGPLLFALLLAGRVSVAGLLVASGLLLHKLTGLFQSRTARFISYAVSAALGLFFAGQYILAHLDHPPTMADLYAFSIVDFLFYILMFYPFILFFVFSSRIKNLTLQRVIRDFIIIMLCALPFIIFEDIFGSITLVFDFASPNPLPLKLFPVYYLMVYVYLLVVGFKHVIRERKAGAGKHAISDEFVKRYAITARETEIIQLMIEGASNKKIGETLFISAATVRNHLHNIFEKTGVANRVELLRLASS